MAATEQASGHRRRAASTALLTWVDQRFPLVRAVEGAALRVLRAEELQLLVLLRLARDARAGAPDRLRASSSRCTTSPSAQQAFASVEYIMRDVPGGWLIRYMHSTGASLFFIFVYLHMFRGLMYGSYRKPRELIWIFGMLIYLTLMAEAFFGYLLPWGQMSYWGAQVIVNLFGTMPLIGQTSRSGSAATTSCPTRR